MGDKSAVDGDLGGIREEGGSRREEGGGRKQEGGRETRTPSTLFKADGSDPESGERTRIVIFI